MLTGKFAFAGKSQLSVASAILEKEPESISATQPLTPPALEHTIRTCLAKDPEDRFQSAHDLKLQLLWIAGSSASSLPVLKPRNTGAWIRNSAPWAAAALALFSGAMLWMTTRGSDAKPAIVRFVIPTPANTQIDLFALVSVAISPDGQSLAYVVKATDGTSRMYLRRMNEFDSKPVPGTESAASPFFSPDGQWIGFFTADRIKKVAVEGGAVSDVANVMPGGQGATWGTDGYIYYNRYWTEGLSRVPQNGGKAETFTSPDAKRHEQSHRWPEVLPDGKNLLFTAVKSFGAENAEIQVLSLRNRTWKTILSNA
jgi:eukaryotic-like serine/threonine-protein kinase